MSLTIHLYYTGKSGSAQAFAREMTEPGLVAAVRQEEGCEQYDYFLPLNDPETVLLIDRWQDQAALDAHHKSDLMKQIALLRDKHRLRLRVERYIDEQA